MLETIEMKAASMFQLIAHEDTIGKAVGEWRRKLTNETGDAVVLTDFGLWGTVEKEAKPSPRRKGTTDRPPSEKPPAFQSTFRVQRADKPNAVLINVPAEGIDENVLGAVACDENGGLWILRQGMLQKSGGMSEVGFGEFPNHTVLQSVEVIPAPKNTDRQYYAVACVDEAPELVRAATASFVQECDFVRRRKQGTLTAAEQRQRRLELALKMAGGSPETREKYQRKARDAKEITVKQTPVWQALLALLGSRMTNPGFGILKTDAVVHRHGMPPILIEIKTDTGSSSIQQGLGQLMIYGDLLEQLGEAAGIARVLLLPGKPPSAVSAVLAARGIAVHTYTEGDPIIFSAAFLQFVSDGPAKV